MDDKEITRRMNAIAFVCHISSGMFEIMATMPDGVNADKIQDIAEISIIDLAKMWSKTAQFPIDQEKYNFKFLGI